MMIFRQLICSLFILNITIHGVYAYDLTENKEVLVDRHLKLPITQDQYNTFQEVRHNYFNDSLSRLETPEHIPFSRWTHAETGDKLFILGTYHNLPFEALPEWFSDFMKSQIKQVCIECNFLTAGIENVSTDKQSLQPDPDLVVKISPVLDPYLTIFSKKTADLSLGQIYNMVMGYDALLGMDATIEMIALTRNIPVVLLDKPIPNMAEFNRRLHRASIQSYIEYLEHTVASCREKNIKNSSAEEILEKQQFLLKMSDEELMNLWIEEEIPRIQQGETLTKEDLTNWSQEYLSCQDPHYLETLRADKKYQEVATDERNNYWIDYLNLHPLSGRLMCIGAAHQPGIFESLRNLGWEQDPHKVTYNRPLV